MKKAEQSINNDEKQQITYTVDETLNKLKGKNLAPGKLAKANKMLSNVKGPLPAAFNLSR